MFYDVWSHAERLTFESKLSTLKKWIEDGVMRVEVNHTYSFDQVKAAYAQFEQGGINSRIAIVPYLHDRATL